MADTIGNAVIQIAADSSKLKAGVSDAKSSLQSLRDTAKEAGESLTSSSTTYLRSLERQTAAIERQAKTFGMSKAEIAGYNAAQQGVSGTAAAMIARLDTAETSLKSQSAAAKLAAIAAGSLGTASAAAGEGMAQLNFQSGGAMRGVIGVGRALADGNFASAGTRMLSLSSRVGAAGLVFSAMGLAVGAVVGVLAAFAVAAVKGAAESTAYNKALILTGNYAGTTASQMSDMAKAISASGGTQGKAAEVLTQLAASGKIAASEFEAITTAAIAMERAGGPAVASMVANMAALADEPTKASEKLNSTMHYLTLATYEQIRAAEELGNKEQAVALAQGANASAVARAAAEMEKNLGILQRAWRAAGDAAKLAWDQMKDIGRPDTDAAKLVQLRADLVATQTRLAAAGAARGPQGPSGAANAPAGTSRSADADRESGLLAQIKILEARTAAGVVAAATVKTDQAGVEAAEKLGGIISANASKADKLKAALLQASKAFDVVRAGPQTDESRAILAKEAATYAGIKASFATGGAKPFTDDAGTRYLQTLREQQAVIVAQLESTDKLTAAESAQATFAKLIADLKEKKTLTADQKSLLAVEGAAKALLAQNVAGEQSVKLKDEQGKLDIKNAAAAKAEADRQEKAIKDMALYTESLNRTVQSYLADQKEQYDARLSVVGMGSQAAEQLNSTLAIRKKFNDETRRLNEAAAKDGTLDSKGYTDGVAVIKAGLADALAANKDYYAQLAVMQGDWTVGARTAVADYLADAADVAKQSQQAFSHAFQGMEDALVTFVTTGKLSFSDLAQSILADLARIIIKQQMASLLTAAIGGTGGSSGWLGMLVGAFGGGGGSGVIAGGGGITLGGVGGLGAIGGDFAANSLTTVNEHGPEMLRVGNKDMLMLGSQPGHITPVGQFGQASGPSVTFNIAAGVQRNELAAMIPGLKAQIKGELMATMRRPGFQRA